MPVDDKIGETSNYKIRRPQRTRRNNPRNSDDNSSISAIRRIAQTVTSKSVAVPQPDGQPKVFAPKIENLANSIAELNLLEVAELSDLLKKKLNLPDTPAISFVGAPAAGAATASKEEEEQTQNVQSLFCVKLKAYDEKQKVALIKEIKTIMEGMNLVQAKKFVESAPVVVKEDISDGEAKKLKEVLSKVGGEIEIV